MSLSLYLKKTPWYLIGGISTKAVGFLLLPILTSHLSPEEMGGLATYESLGRILLIVMSLYLDAAFIRFYYSLKNDENITISSFFSTHFWFMLLWGGGVLVAFVIFWDASIWNLPSLSFYALLALGFSQLINQLVVMLTSVWRAELLAIRTVVFQIFVSVGIFVLTYGLLLSDLGWESKIYATFSVAILQMALLLFVAVRNGWLKFSFDKEIARRSLIFSIPLLPTMAAGWISMFSDRLILSYYGLLDQVGVYSVAAQVALIIYVFNDAVTKVQSPIAMRGMTEDRDAAKTEVSKFISIYCLLLALIYSLLASFSDYFVGVIFPGEYSEVGSLFAILGLIYVFSGIYRVFSNTLSFHGKTWVLGVAALVQAILNVVLNLLFIPDYGMYAAAFSSLLSVFSYMAILVLAAQIVDPIKINFKVVGASSVAVLVAFYFSF